MRISPPVRPARSSTFFLRDPTVSTSGFSLESHRGAFHLIGHLVLEAREVLEVRLVGGEQPDVDDDGPVGLSLGHGEDARAKKVVPRAR